MTPWWKNKTKKNIIIIGIQVPTLSFQWSFYRFLVPSPANSRDWVSRSWVQLSHSSHGTVLPSTLLCYYPPCKKIPTQLSIFWWLKFIWHPSLKQNKQNIGILSQQFLPYSFQILLLLLESRNIYYQDQPEYYIYLLLLYFINTFDF